MAKQMIKVRLVGDGMVPDFEAMEEGLLRFHGWKHDPNLGELVTVFEGGRAKKVRSGAFVTADGPVDLVLPFRPEYAHEVRGGVFVALDEESARLCGVPFKAPVTTRSEK